MASEAFTIREIDGLKRSVALFNRALPYQGVSWPREQRVKKAARCRQRLWKESLREGLTGRGRGQ